MASGYNYIAGETGVCIYLVLWFNNFKHQKLERRDVITKWVSLCFDHTNEQPERYILPLLMKNRQVMFSLEGSGLLGVNIDTCLYVHIQTYKSVQKARVNVTKGILTLK